MSVHELALQRSKYKHLSDEEWRWFLQQVEGRERTAEKLPTFAAIEEWWYPVRLSCEQCSSEAAARYKAGLVHGTKMADLTGGYGVDTFFMSERFEQTDYVEQNAELCRIAAHNFAGKAISIHSTTAETFLEKAGVYDLIFLDPARRDNYGGKVFRLEDCTPDVVQLLPDLLAHGQQLMIKLSPMLDLTQAVKALPQAKWDIHVVAIKNEVKEVLLVSHPHESAGEPTITAVDLDKREQAFVFSRGEETEARSALIDRPMETELFLYEPNAAILKAGAYKLAGERFGLLKLDVNTHLYASERLIEDFPGRVWKATPLSSLKERMISQANVLVRNYPLTAEQLKKKLRVRDGGSDYVIGCRVSGKPMLFIAERV